MYKSVLFTIVKKRIDEFDPKNFLGSGAPENEYDFDDDARAGRACN